MFSKNNNIYIVGKGGKRTRRAYFIPGLSVHFKGKNSSLTLFEPIPKFEKCKIKVYDDCQITIKSSKFKIKKLQIQGSSNLVCEIGENFTTHGCEIMFADEPSQLSVKIGDNCLFAKDILIRVSDGHAIFDKDTGTLKNPGRSIEIENNVWVAGNVAILKGVHIPCGCVIGHGSVVAKSCDESCSVYAGNPARLVRRNVLWSSDSPNEYLKRTQNQNCLLTP